jgi:hypothetical protein
MNTFISFSPVYLAIGGLVLFLLAQFLKSTMRIVVSFLSILLIISFFFKLFSLKNEDRFASHDFSLSIFNIFFLLIAFNVTSFLLWLYVVLKTIFTDVIAKGKQQMILIAAGIILVAGFFIVYIFGTFVGLICLPILTISFYFAFKNYASRSVKAFTAI